MKFRIFTLFVALACFTGVSAQNIPELLWYKFDGAGTSIPNLASAPPAGTATAAIVGAQTQGGSALCSGTLIGTGAASNIDYVNTGWATNLSGTSWTISFRSANISGTSSLWYIFGDPNAGGFRCFTNGVAGANNWILRGPISDITILNGAVVAPTMNTFVYDAVAGQTYAYLNGVLVSTVTQAAPTINAAGPFKVGAYSTNNGLNNGGFLDDFRVYSRALTAAEILQIYSGEVISNFLPADSSLCPSDSLLLSVPSGSTTTWSTGDTSSSIYATSGATYSVSFQGTCEFGSDTITLAAAPTLPAGFLGPDITVCTDDSTMLIADSAATSFMWSTGDTSSSIWVVGPGYYTSTISGTCNTVSDSIELIQSALIYTGFLGGNTTNACVGDSIVLGASGSYTNYMWSDSSNWPTLAVTTAGTYQLAVSDGCGAGVDSVAVTFTPGPTASFGTSLNMLTASFSNTSTGNNPTYLWDFGNGNTSTFANPSHTYSGPGTYIVTLTVTDPCGSSVFTNTIFVTNVAVDPALDLGVALYPNPAQNMVTLTASLPHAQALKFSLLNTLGQVVRTQDLGVQAGELKHSFSVQGLSDGIYFVRLDTENGPVTTRLTVRN
jgi:PKD repeat protein